MESGNAQRPEKASLLQDRRTSSLDEEPLVTMSPLIIGTTPTSQTPEAMYTARSISAADQQGTDTASRLQGMALAGLSTVFQAVISVCAKRLGVLLTINVQAMLIIQSSQRFASQHQPSSCMCKETCLF